LLPRRVLARQAARLIAVLWVFVLGPRAFLRNSSWWAWRWPTMTSPAIRPCGAALGEDAYATGSDQPSDDDQHAAPEDLTPEQGDDPCHDQHNRKNPQQKLHAERFTRLARAQTRLCTSGISCQFRSLTPHQPVTQP